MLKVVTFMKQVAMGLQVEENFGTAHVYRSSLNAIIAYCGEEDLLFSEVNFGVAEGIRSLPSQSWL